MNERAAIQSALRSAGFHSDLRDCRPLPGGCIHHVVRVTIPCGNQFVAKLNQPCSLGIFQEEAAGLEALADTRTILVPKVCAVGVFEGRTVLLMDYLQQQSAAEETWIRFGKELAALHRAPAGDRYGFRTDNHLGSTPQPNTLCDDWVEFNQLYRLGHQVQLAEQGGLLEERERRRLSLLIEHLDGHLPRKPRPSLLHGDLWSGNALPSVDQDGQGRIAVIDPACSIGDAYADIAMMQLFGGFPQSCHAAWQEAMQADGDRVERRIAVYQLYHLLNHLNLFGRGYAGQVMSIVGRLGA